MFDDFTTEIQSDEIASLINQWDEDLEEMESMINSMVEYAMAISSNGYGYNPLKVRMLSSNLTIVTISSHPLNR